MRCGGDALDMHSHAGAYVEHQQNIHRKIFIRQIVNRDRSSFLAKEEVVDVQSSDRTLRTIQNQGINPPHSHIAVEDGSIIVRGRESTGEQKWDEHNLRSHRTPFIWRPGVSGV
jgi:hypothetical protein